MHQLAWVRLMVARHPSIYWLAIALIAAVVGLSAAKAMSSIDAARRSWGQQQTVWITTAAVEPGQPIVAEARDVPAAVVPVDAVLVSPGGVVARQRIGAGEMISDADIAVGGSAGLIPEGWVAFAVPGTVAHFSTDDHLSVYSADQFIATGVVIADGDVDVMVAIPADAAPTMAAALLADAVILALTPGP
ncbi:MAG: hypothetical protein ABI862_00450 [Ilumatobacteraceae bacterium]